jgi:hypothetical protein
MLRSAMAISAALLLLGSGAMAQGAAAPAQGAAAPRACAADIKTLCEGVKPGQGRIASCIKENFSKLSQPCQDQLATAAAGAKACAADVKQHCANARRRIEVIRCLRPALANVGDTCRSALAQVAARRN